MKSSVTFILGTLLVVSSTLFSQDTYYWYKGEKISLQKDSSQYLVGFEMPQQNQNVKSVQILDRLYWELSDNKNFTNAIYHTTIYYHNQGKVYISNKFYVKLREYSDTTTLSRLAKESNVYILRENKHCPKLYILACDAKSNGNALEMANRFYETSLFEYAEPEFLFFDKYCSNDYYFVLQQNLYDDGWYVHSYTDNLSINYCDVKSITAGSSNIKIALLDAGVLVTHPDLNVTYTYNVSNENYYNYDFYDEHGTECAGIINAQANNYIGVCGIAPDCSLMNIAMPYPPTTEYCASGIWKAIEDGADVLNCSWGGSSSCTTLDRAISDAIQQGRNGLGCVIIMAAGNDYPYLLNDSVRYPANSNSNIIVVGAMTTCGNRKSYTSCEGDSTWSSCFGNQLDVMAPGVAIPTTSIKNDQADIKPDYSLIFSGTSAAAPHVAAIAGLMLSINPTLTQKQVADIIESTARKVNENVYNYIQKAGRPNGAWNIEMGYGLVDAYAAVKEAGKRYIQNKTYASGTSIVEYYPEIFAGYSVTNAVPYGNVVVKSGSNVTFKATDAIRLRSGFRVEKGANFRAYIEPVSPPSSSAPSMIRDNDNEECVPTGINSIETVANNSFSVFPNPAKDNITISSSEPIAQTKLYNLNGQLVLQTAETEIDVSALSAGIYIIHAQTTSGQLLTAKFVHL